MAQLEQHPSAADEELPLERIHELLAQLKGAAPEDVAWELGIHIETLSDALKESAAHQRGVEEENRQLQERLLGERREYAELRASMDELLNLHELSDTISSSFDIEDILASLIDLSGRFVEYLSCGVFALDEQEARLVPLTLRGAPGLVEHLEAQWEDGIIDWVMREARPVVIEDMGTIEQLNVAKRSTVVVPMIVRGKQIGVYALYCSRAKDEFAAGEIELLGVLASQATIAATSSTFTKRPRGIFDNM